MKPKFVCVVLAALLCLSAGVTEMIGSHNKVAYATEYASGASKVSARGVWHRPNDTGTETTLKGVTDVLDKLARAGINLVFLETFYHGMAAYRSDKVSYYTGFDNYDYGEYPDYLSCFVAEAAKRGIEVHAWVEDFYVGIAENQFTKYLPDWLMVTDKGETRQKEGNGYIFLDPTNDSVCDFLVSLYDEILTRFDGVAGLNLDYIRYPLSDAANDTGFTAAAMSKFSALHGIDGEFSPQEYALYIRQHNLYSDWVDFRADAVTSFVEKVFRMVSQKHPDKLLSTAIFPEPRQSYNTKKQDFAKWIKSGYLDIVTPMAYYDDNATLRSALTEMLKDCSSCYCYAGLSSTYHNLSNDKVLSQLDVCSQTGADGFVLFGSKSVLNNNGYIELLHEQFQKVTSALPHSQVRRLYNNVVPPLLAELRNRGESQSNIDAISKELLPLYSCDETNLSDLSQAVKKLRLLVNYNLSAYLSAQNVSLAKDCLEDLLRFVTVRQQRLTVRQGKTDDGDKPDPTPSDPSDNKDKADDSSDTAAVLGIVGGAVLLAVGIAAIANNSKRKKK